MPMKPVPLLMVSALVLVLLFGFLGRTNQDANPDSHANEPQQADVRQERSNIHNNDGQAHKTASPFQQQGIQEAIRGVAKNYAAQSRFPASSMPIPDEASLQKYIPNQAAGASLPYEGPNGDAWRFGLRTDHYRYFKGDGIQFYVTLTGGSEIPSANVRVLLVSNKRVIHEVAAGPLVAGSFQAGLDTQQVNTRSWPNELHVQAIADVAGQTLQVIETIRFEESIADVKSVGHGDVEGENLVIPVTLDTQAEGYFRVTAVLFSATTQKPLVHLEGKARLNVNNDTVSLKAHADALQVSGDEGPYQLQHVYVEKMPGPPDYASAYGKSSDAVYPIAAQSFEQYADVRHEDPSAQRSLEFLNKMGGTQTQP